MTRILFFLAVAAFVCMVIGLIAAILKVTAALAIVAVGGLAILSVAVWLLIRTNGERRRRVGDFGPTLAAEPGGPYSLWPQPRGSAG